MLAATMTAGFGWLGMGLKWLWMLPPLGLVVGAVWLVASAVGGSGGRSRGDDAAAVPRQRLAVGEIDVEQHEKTRSALGLPDGRLAGQQPA